MYCGKTTIGRRLARRLGLDFVDLDVAFEERYRINVPTFFQKYGEEAFRTIERKLLHDTEAMDNVVVATGGGTPCFFDNMEFINHTGTSVYLFMSPAAIASRASTSKKMRPLLANLTPEQRLEKIQQQLALREQYYKRAHHQFDAFSPDLDALVEEICQKIEG